MAEAGSHPALEISDLHVYYGESHAIQGVSMTIRGGVLAVVGRTGMGKSTLCNTIAGLKASRSGSIRIFGRETSRLEPHIIHRHGVGYVPQGRRVWPSLSVDEHLRLVATDGFNPEPIELVADPVAAMPRSSITSDGKFVLFLTDVAPTGGTLHVVGMDGGEVLSFPGVLDVLAAHGSGIVFTDHASDPDVYPNVADLEYIDVASMSEPVLVEGAVLDAKNFQLDARGERVIYLRSGVDRDTDDPEHDGVFACDLP